MRSNLIIALALIVVASGTLAADTKSDKDLLQGNWQIVSVEIEGEKLAMDSLKESRLSVAKEQYSFRLNDTRLELTYKLQSKKSPKAIDLTVVEGDEKGKVYHGIYKFDGDTYVICRTTEPGKNRPTEFATGAKGSGLMMVVWKRVK